MRPTAFLPVLAPRAGSSLSFVLPTPPAALVPAPAPELPVSVWFPCAPEHWFSVWSRTRARALSFSLVRVCALELRFSLVARAFRAHGLSPLSRVCRSASPASSPAQVAAASRRPSSSAPSPFCLSSDICAISVRGFTAPCFVPQYSALEVFICRDPDVSSCVSG